MVTIWKCTRNLAMRVLQMYITEYRHVPLISVKASHAQPSLNVKSNTL